MDLYTAAQMREMDRVAIEERGVPSTLLMERAAKAIVQEVLALPIPRTKKPDGSIAFVCRSEHAPSQEKLERMWMDHWAGQQRSAVVFCGPGNNGGDGIAAARFLMQAGWKVRCLLVGKREKMTEDSREMERRLIEAGGALEDFDRSDQTICCNVNVAIDALFGVGLNSALRPDAQCAVKYMRQAMWTVSADIPSGIHADTGEVMGCAVRADVTVTFSDGKPGLFVGQGAIHAGRVVVADIGVAHVEESVTHVIDRPKLPKRRRDAHKGDFGKLFILAGSVGYTGAPVLAAQAAVRAGAGLVTLAVPPEIYPIAAVKCDEAMVWPWPERDEDILEKAKGCGAALIGPGLGQGERAERLVLMLLQNLTCPVILDADGLNIISRHMNVLDGRESLTVLTPHDGEFSRLSGCQLPIVDRLSVAREFAARHHCVLVLKGHRTIVAAPQGECFINTTGNPGMARGGSGDALAGLMAGLTVQPRIGSNGIVYAVWLHGRAGDLAAADRGEYGMTVGELIGQIPYAMKECEEE